MLNAWCIWPHFVLITTLASRHSELSSVEMKRMRHSQFKLLALGFMVNGQAGVRTQGTWLWSLGSWPRWLSKVWLWFFICRTELPSGLEDVWELWEPEHEKRAWRESVCELALCRCLGPQARLEIQHNFPCQAQSRCSFPILQRCHKEEIAWVMDCPFEVTNWSLRRKGPHISG